MGKWLAIMLSASLFFLLGTRLTTFTQDEWISLFSNGTWPVSYHKFAVGGTCFALVGIILTKKFLAFNSPVLQVYAYVTPIGLAIQKLGCLISGCCFGLPTTLPWGIKYAQGTLPYNDHIYTGLIEHGELYSLPIHPTQVYQIIIYLLISILVLSFNKRFRNPKSVITFALLLLSGSRFMLEFLIDPQASVYGGDLIIGLKLVQWICLTGFLLCLAILIIFEKYYIKDVINNQRVSEVVRPIIVFSFVTGIFILLHNAFTSYELIAFNIRFLIITCLFGYIIFRKISIPRLKILSPALIILPLFLISQTVQHDKPLDYDKNSKVNFGTTIGHYYNRVLYNPGPGSCGGLSYTKIPYENNYYTLGGGYSITGRSGFQSYSYGGYLTGGFVTERNMDTDISKVRPLFIANPYAEYNWHWLGVGANIHLGYIPFAPLNPYDSSVPPEKNHKITPVMPGFSARIGPYNWLYSRIQFASGFPSPFPSDLWDISIGSGFGFKNGSGLRVGSIISDYENIYFEGQFLLKERVEIGLRYSFGDAYFTNDGTSNEFKLGVGIILDKE